MDTFEFCIDSLLEIVPGVLYSGKNNLTAAKNSIEMANSYTVDGIDTSGLANAIAWIDRTIGCVEQWESWIQEKISALEKLNSDNNQLASLLGEDFDIDNIDLDNFLNQAEKMLGLIGEGIGLKDYLEQLKNASIGNSKADKEWVASTVLELLKEESEKKSGIFVDNLVFSGLDYQDGMFVETNNLKNIEEIGNFPKGEAPKEIMQELAARGYTITKNSQVIFKNRDGTLVVAPVNKDGQITFHNMTYPTHHNARRGVSWGPTGILETHYNMNMRECVNRLKNDLRN